MTSGLRKKHARVWTVLLFLVPAGIMAGWLAIPANPITESAAVDKTAALPEILYSLQKKNYTVNLRSDNKRSSLQLEWISKSGPSSPSALIYLASGPSASITSNSLIGRIEGKGTFYFPLKNNLSALPGFILYDIIHHQVIDRVNF